MGKGGWALAATWKCCKVFLSKVSEDELYAKTCRQLLGVRPPKHVQTPPYSLLPELRP